MAAVSGTSSHGGEDVNDSPRREELATRLAAVRERISTACEAAGRKPEDVTLVAVTKTFPLPMSGC